jgi:hypothetical protein
MAITASVPVSRSLSELELASLVHELGATSAQLAPDHQSYLQLIVQWADSDAPAQVEAKRVLAAAVAARLIPLPRSQIDSHKPQLPPASLVEVLPCTFAALPEFAQLAEEVDLQIAAAMGELGAQQYWLPSLLPRSVFASSVLETVTLGGDINLHHQDQVFQMRLTHAACMGFYPLFANREVQDLALGTSRVKCFRSEPLQRWPHLPEYTVREFIAIGQEVAVQEIAERASITIKSLFGRWGLTLQDCVASDSFLATDLASVAFQALSASKRELLHAGVALGSLNLHRGHFTRQWNITSAARPAASCCLGIGLERTTAALLKAHSQDFNRTWDVLRMPSKPRE